VMWGRRRDPMSVRGWQAALCEAAPGVSAWFLGEPVLHLLFLSFVGLSF